MTDSQHLRAVSPPSADAIDTAQAGVLAAVLAVLQTAQRGGMELPEGRAALIARDVAKRSREHLARLAWDAWQAGTRIATPPEAHEADTLRVPAK